MAEARHITELSLAELAEVERVEAELDSFIEKRAREARDQERTDELWAKSVREQREKHRKKVAEEWFSYHDRLLRSHEDTLGALVFYHRKERARYGRILGLPEVGSEGEEA